MAGSWEKLGLLYDPKPIHSKLVSHAANPLPILLEGDVYRIFFSGRDHENRSSVGFADIDILTRQVIYVHDRPVFEHGGEGSFYSHGVSIGNVYQANGRHYMGFMGWQYPPGEHWRGEIGRLILSGDLCTLEPAGDKPLLARDETDPVSLSYPWIMEDRQGGYHMWYGSTVTWDAGNGEMLHVIRYAHSADGSEWHRKGDAVPHPVGVAQAFSRPTVVQDENGWHMWFSYRSGTGETYRVGYAHSSDGLQWHLSLEQTGITVSSQGWDSEMIEYPFVFDHRGNRYMLYNGNGYGETGFGIAVFRTA